MVTASQDKLSLREKWGMIGGIVCVIVTCAGIVAVISLVGILGQLQGCKEENNKIFTAEGVIKHLKLEGHTAGGYFYEHYRSSDTIRVFRPQTGSYVYRSVSTAIYYLFVQGTISNLQRLKSDEILHHYMGGPLRMIFIHKDGSYEEKLCGKDIENNESPAVLVPADSWFVYTLADDSDYALVGATVAPGFYYQDYVVGNRTELLQTYPQHRDIIMQYTSE